MRSIESGSVLQFVSQGTVAENKAQGSRTVEVELHEIMRNGHGELTQAKSTLPYQGTAKTGAYTGKLITGRTVSAVWYPSGDNRISPPDLVRGEIVEVYRLGSSDDSGTYYWRATGIGSATRGTETLIVGIAAAGKPGDSDTELGKDNTYFFEISSANKSVTLSTSDANGEFASHTVQLDTASGKWEVADSKGNLKLVLDAKKQEFLVSNKMGSSISMSGGVIKIHGKDAVQITTSGGATLKLVKSVVTMIASVFRGQRG